MANQIKTTLRVEKIQKVETQTKNTDKETYRMIGKDADGVGTIVVTLPVAFDGFKPDAVVDVTISTSQTSLKEFEKAAGKEDNSSEKKKKKKEA